MQMIELLENRQLLSATGVVSTGHTVGHELSVHAPLQQAALVKYAGTLIDASSKVVAKVQMALRSTDAGDFAELCVQMRRGKLKVFVMIDASGAFTYDKTDHGRTFHLEGQRSDDGLTVAGTWSDTRTDGSSEGTFSLATIGDKKSNPEKKGESDKKSSGGDHKDGSDDKGASDHKPAGGDTKKESDEHHNPSPSPTPAPTPDASVTFAGPFSNSNGETGKVNIVVRNVGGEYRGEFHTGPGPTSVLFRFDSSGHFTWNSSDGKYHVEGQISSDGKTITGSVTGTRPDGSTMSGTFTLSRT